MVGLATKDARPNLHYDLINPQDGINYGCPEKGWRYDKNSMAKLIESKRILWPDTPHGRPRRKAFLSELSDDNLPGFSSIIENGVFTNTATKEIHALLDGHWFDFPKPSILIKDFLQQTTFSDSIILDFFSGSATTAHAVMQLNAEDGGNRKFIMVQLPELTDEKSEAYKAGYKTICEIGKERIRRAGRKIKEDSPLTTQDLDTGFRVLKLDSSNMKEVYYTPAKIVQGELFEQVDNVKSDRTAEDLLFQVMLELGATLDSKIETEVVAGKTIYNVADGYLVACFDKDVTDEVVTTIAKMHPLYAVLRDTSMANDSTATNFEQLFKTYSPDTVTKIL